jgi:hypothetical protein
MESDAVNFVERALDLGQSAIVAIFGGIVGFVFWIVRIVITDQRRIDIMASETKSVKESLKRIEDFLIQDGLRGREK